MGEVGEMFLYERIFIYLGIINRTKVKGVDKNFFDFHK